LQNGSLNHTWQNTIHTYSWGILDGRRLDKTVDKGLGG